MMTLKVEKETQFGPQYKIIYDYNNPYEQKLHYLMMGVEHMLNCIPSGPITRARVYKYDAHVPEFIPECYVQYVTFEMVWTPRDGGNHINILIRHPETLCPIDGLVSPVDYIEYCKYKVLTKLLFDGHDYWELPYKNDQQVFSQCRNWIYGHFGFNARTKIWDHFERQVAEEIQKKYPTKEAFATYVKEAAKASLEESGITPDLSYYDDRFKSKVCQYSKGIDRFYQEG